MHRFKISFDNSSYLAPKNNNSGANIVKPSLGKPVISRPALLNAPMIDRVHKAKAGCSACGKKVA